MEDLVQKNYNRWINSPVVSDEDKKILQNMDEKTKNESFFENIKFGTAGLRGVLGPGTNRMNYFTVRKATVGFGLYLIEKFKGNIKVAIAHDNRHFSREFTQECCDILNEMGIDTYIFDSLRPTPELSFAVRYLKCSGGIMITASHNPKEYNGYKVYDETGCQLTPDSIAPLIKIISGFEDELNLTIPASKNKGKTVILNNEVDDEYVKLCESIEERKDLNKKNFKIVYTPNHGTSLVNALRVFKDLGYEVYPVLSQCTFDPDFSGTLSPNPEDEKSFIEPIKYACEIDADLICMTDPDGDRVGLATKVGKGVYKTMTGNESACLLMDYLFKARQEKGTLHKNGVMFNTVVSSELGQKVASFYNIATERLLTGFKFIGDRVNYYEKNNGLIYEFGYEESYGCLPHEFVRDKDGIQAILLYSEMALYYKEKGLNLIQAYEQLCSRFGYHKATLFNIYLKGSEGLKEMQRIMDQLINGNINEIGGHKVVMFEDYFNRIRFDHKENKKSEIVGLPKGDLVKFYLDDETTICVRPSGTEPKIKFYIECVKENLEKSLDSCKIYYEKLLEVLNINL